MQVHNEEIDSWSSLEQLLECTKERDHVVLV